MKLFTLTMAVILHTEEHPGFPSQSLSLFPFFIPSFLLPWESRSGAVARISFLFFSVTGKVYKKYLTLKYRDVKGVDEHDFLWFRLQ